jgi:response regulator RpfG family c-di-GMP phosphodiesterase
LLNKIHSIKPGLPVLIITALPKSEIGEQLLEHGVIDYLEKPVEPVQILTRVRKILANHA